MFTYVWTKFLELFIGFNLPLDHDRSTVSFDQADNQHNETVDALRLVVKQLSQSVDEYYRDIASNYDYALRDGVGCYFAAMDSQYLANSEILRGRYDILPAYIRLEENPVSDSSIGYHNVFLNPPVHQTPEGYGYGYDQRMRKGLLTALAKPVWVNYRNDEISHHTELMVTTSKGRDPLLIDPITVKSPDSDLQTDVDFILRDHLFCISTTALSLEGLAGRIKQLKYVIERRKESSNVLIKTGALIELEWLKHIERMWLDNHVLSNRPGCTMELPIIRCVEMDDQFSSDLATALLPKMVKPTSDLCTVHISEPNQLVLTISHGPKSLIHLNRINDECCLTGYDPFVELLTTLGDYEPPVEEEELVVVEEEPVMEEPCLTELPGAIVQATRLVSNNIRCKSIIRTVYGIQERLYPVYSDIDGTHVEVYTKGISKPRIIKECDFAKEGYYHDDNSGLRIQVLISAASKRGVQAMFGTPSGSYRMHVGNQLQEIMPMEYELDEDLATVEYIFTAGTSIKRETVKVKGDYQFTIHEDQLAKAIDQKNAHAKQIAIEQGSPSYIPKRKPLGLSHLR